jgi:hypothetical protein
MTLRTTVTLLVIMSDTDNADGSAVAFLDFIEVSR